MSLVPSRIPIKFTGLFYNLQLIFLVCVSSFSPLAAQIPFTNIGFESGTFLNWQGATGSCCPVYAPNQGIAPNRHNITTGSGIDTLSNNLIKQVCAGSIHSAQLGNSGGDAESEQLHFQMIIPSDSLILAVKYAVLLQNAQHPPSKQPRFRYAITTSGTTLAGCTEKLILAGDTTVPFLHYQDIDILPWQTTAIDLSGKSGDTLMLTFETGDCEPGGHFGYAYVDLMLLPKKIYLNGCNTDGSLTASVTSGLDGIWMNGSATDSIHIENPDSTNDIYYLLNANTDCELIIYAEPEMLLPSSEFTFTEMCEQQIEFNADNSTNSTLVWDFGDGNNSVDSNVMYQYNFPGNFEVVLSAMGSNNCTSTTRKQITVHENPIASFSVGDTCAGAPVLLKNESQNADNYFWYVNNHLNDTTKNPVNLILIEGINSLQLIAANHIGCCDTSNVTLNIKPEIECLFPENYLFIPNAFSPNGDGINDLYEIINLDNDKVFEIYNRFGQLIYSGNSWNGSYENDVCETGVYLVNFQYNKKQLHQTITLLK
ncbi:MAG: gliding motility-associated C-terminal domain-containing protein [Bacteroidia bacterium]|nr:gliding motility-associated C-terminal domain-containing protein [Bacteroidota bacterium]MBP9082201.1 gliding motility-associated C-terminal domain-containing protein [Bacteroidia bacterium]